MRIVMVGDTHGSVRDVKEAVRRAKDFQTDRIYILGDFGLWWGYKGVEFIDDINEYARKNNVHIFALPGNHENYDWWNATVATAPTSKGHAYLRTNVLLSPRTHTWNWAGKQFAVAGGAVSIDKQWRKAGESWSPDEELTDDEVEGINLWGHRVDYLLTHDCSDFTPFHGRLKPDADSQRHRKRVDRVLQILKPRMHFHGHMHTRYDWDNLWPYGYSAFDEGEWTGPVTKTYGLECNNDWWSWGVLDTETDKFLWRGEHEKPAAQREEEFVPTYDVTDDDF
jgi:hypothetical protein